MTIDVRCTDCGKQLKVKEQYAGRTGKCPECGGPVPIPLVNAPASDEWGQWDDTDTIRCPMCGERVPSHAKKCEFCGERLGKSRSYEDDDYDRRGRTRTTQSQDSSNSITLFVTGLIGCMSPFLTIYGIIFLVRRPYSFPNKGLAIAGTILHVIWTAILIGLYSTGNFP